MKTIFTYTRKLFMFLLLCAPLSISWANTTTFNTQEEQETTTNISQKNDDIEIIGVVGEYSLLHFRHEMQDAELDFYDAYNKLADVEEFKMHCDRTGGSIRVIVCVPNYVRERIAQTTQRVLFSGGVFPNFKEVDFMVRKQREESLAYVEKVVNDNPELLDKLVALNERKIQFNEAKAVRFP